MKPMPLPCALILTSCALASNAAALEPVAPDQFDSLFAELDIDPELLDSLSAEVGKARWEIKQSLPELRLARTWFPLSKKASTIRLRASNGRFFEVLVLNCRALSIPGSHFMLAYLRDPQGKIADWRSRWLPNRFVTLEARILDVNDDGIKELCVVSKPLKNHGQLLSAWCVRNGRFDPVIAENTTSFDVVFKETAIDGNVVIQPHLKGGYSWRTDKLYEIPVRIINRSSTDSISLKGCSVALSGEFCGTVYGRGLDTDALRPGAAVATTLTVRFCGSVPDGRLGFKLDQDTDTQRSPATEPGAPHDSATQR